MSSPQIDHSDQIQDYIYMWLALESHQKNKVVIGAVGSLGLGVGVVALTGSLIGVGASAGVVWSITALASGVVTATRESVKKLSLRSFTIATLAASFFAGAAALMASSGLGFTSALVASGKMFLMGSAVMGSLVILALFIGALAKTNDIPKK